MQKLILIIQAVLLLLSSAGPTTFLREVNVLALKMTSDADISFVALSSDEIRINDAEKSECRKWYEENLLTNENPVYDFRYGNKTLRKNIKEWEITVGSESGEDEVYAKGKTTVISLMNTECGLSAEVEATIFEDYATCRWTVFIKNEGSSDSPVITDFSAAEFDAGIKDADLYYSKASEPANDDFTLYKTPLSLVKSEFSADGGRNNQYMPFFNLSGKDSGLVFTVNWTGQWYVSVKKSAAGEKICMKQELFDAYLVPGEEVRSPMATVSFYNGGNPLKGFNIFRKYVLDSVYPENINPGMGYVIANEFNTKTCDELIEEVNSISPEILEDVDYFWMDAGWYKYESGWYDGVGNWTPDPRRFPDTIKPLSDAMAAKGKKFLLWFEPERVRENTILYNEGMKHDSWIVQIGDNLMWNLGDSDACDYLSRYIVKSIKENGVTMYRQDFNFTPLEYWQKADKNFYSGRKGICENHYVTNLYRYLDYLLDTCDGLVIDNCASGGKRLDLEMSSRSIPLWRSDYNCGNSDGTIKHDVLEATQTMTYGISFWLPYTGTNRYFHSEYASRSCILSHSSVYQPSPEEFAKYKSLQLMMKENYYPLEYGTAGTKDVCAFSFGNEDEGYAIIYKRENVRRDDFTVKFSSLNPDYEYAVSDFDNPGNVIVMSGKDLMEKGVQVKITETPKAAIFIYSQAQ